MRLFRSACLIALLLPAGGALAGAPRSIVIDGNLPDGGDCAALGSWNGSGLCDIDTVMLGTGDELIVESATLELGSLVNLGGVFDNRDTAGIGDLRNAGTILSGPDATLFLWGSPDPAGLQRNSGLIDSDGPLYFFGGFRNESRGRIEVSDGVLISTSTGGFRNAGTLVVDGGTLSADQSFENAAGATIVVKGGGSAFFDSVVVLSNHGRIDNYTWFGGFGWAMTNAGVFNNYGTLTTCDDFLFGSITNSGELNNFGSLGVCGDVENAGMVNNAGQINGFYDGSVPNLGTIIDCGLISAPVTGNSPVADADGDGDGWCDQRDCAAGDATLWQSAGDARLLRLAPDELVPELTRLDWSSPLYPGGAGSLTYDLISAGGPLEFDAGAFCVEAGDGADATASDTVPVSPGEIRYYLVRAQNPCGGSAGATSAGVSRSVRSCP
jgi:hypothetical protein